MGGGGECQCSNQESAESTSADDCYRDNNVEFVCLIRIREEAGPNAIVVGGAAGSAVIFFLFIVLVVVVIIRQKNKRRSEEEKETVDFNPVYATYQVHDDPVAEVQDQNLEYGKVY